MILFGILGVVIGLIGGIILLYPVFKPEKERRGEEVRAGGNLQKAMDKLGEPYFWTDKKIAVIGLAVALIGAILAILNP